MDELIAFLRARLDDAQLRIVELRELTAEDEGWLQRDEEFPPAHDGPMIDIDAKRRIIDLYIERLGGRDLSRYGEFGSLKDDPEALAVTVMVETLRLLALPFAGHPAFKEEWRV